MSNIELVPEGAQHILFGGYNLVLESHQTEQRTEDVYSKNGMLYILVSNVQNNRRNGKAELIDSDNRIVALYTFKDNQPNGPCKLLNNIGSVVFSGSLLGDFVSGLFYEYSDDGQELFCGFYQNGVRIPQFEAIPDKAGYFFEHSRENGEIVAITQYSPQKREKFGVCFDLDENGNVIREVILGHNGEVCIKRSFCNDEMTEYFNGDVIYKGGYYGDWKQGFFRHNPIINTMTNRNDDRPVIVEKIYHHFLPNVYQERTEDGKILRLSEMSDNLVRNGRSIRFQNDIAVEECQYRDNNLLYSHYSVTPEGLVEKNSDGVVLYKGEYFFVDYRFIRWGKGKEYDRNGFLQYEGEFVNGYYHGQGVYYQNRLAYFCGYWEYGYPEGDGRLYNDNCEVILQGKWKMGYLNGVDYLSGSSKPNGCFLPFYDPRVKEVKERQKLVETMQWKIKEWKKTTFQLERSLKGVIFPLDMKEYVLEDQKTRLLYDKFRQFRLIQLEQLQRIRIEQGFFQNVREFVIDGLPSLESVRIGERCFRIDHEEHDDGVCRITNCPNLRQLEISDKSFESFKLFELSNLNSIQSIEFGDGCIRYADLSLKDLPSLEVVTFGDYSFTDCHIVVFENLPKLHTISFNGDYVLAGDMRDNRKTIINGHESFDNTLIMKNLPSLTQIQGNRVNIHRNMGYVILENIPNLTENNIHYGEDSFEFTADLQSTNAPALEKFIREPDKRIDYLSMPYPEDSKINHYESSRIIPNSRRFAIKREEYQFSSCSETTTEQTIPPSIPSTPLSSSSSSSSTAPASNTGQSNIPTPPSIPSSFHQSSPANHYTRQSSMLPQPLPPRQPQRQPYQYNPLNRRSEIHLQQTTPTTDREEMKNPVNRPLPPSVLNSKTPTSPRPGSPTRQNPFPPPPPPPPVKSGSRDGSSNIPTGPIYASGNLTSIAMVKSLPAPPPIPAPIPTTTTAPTTANPAPVPTTAAPALPPLPPPTTANPAPAPPLPSPSNNENSGNNNDQYFHSTSRVDRQSQQGSVPSGLTETTIPMVSQTFSRNQFMDMNTNRQSGEFSSLQDPLDQTMNESNVCQKRELNVFPTSSQESALTSPETSHAEIQETNSNPNTNPTVNVLPPSTTVAPATDGASEQSNLRLSTSMSNTPTMGDSMPRFPEELHPSLSSSSIMINNDDKQSSSSPPGSSQLPANANAQFVTLISDTSVIRTPPKPTAPFREDENQGEIRNVFHKGCMVY